MVVGIRGGGGQFRQYPTTTPTNLKIQNEKGEACAQGAPLPVVSKFLIKFRQRGKSTPLQQVSWWPERMFWSVGGGAVGKREGGKDSGKKIEGQLPPPPQRERKRVPQQTSGRGRKGGLRLKSKGG